MYGRNCYLRFLTGWQTMNLFLCFRFWEMRDGIRALAELAMMAPSLQRASILAWTLRFSSRSSYTHSYKQTYRRSVEHINTQKGLRGIYPLNKSTHGISTELINVCNGLKGISTEKKVTRTTNWRKKFRKQCVIRVCTKVMIKTFLTYVFEFIKVETTIFHCRQTFLGNGLQKNN